MFKRKNNYVIATPNAFTRQARRKMIIRLSGLTFLCLAVILITRQWQPGEITAGVVYEDTANAEQQSSEENGFIKRMLDRDRLSTAPTPQITRLDKAFLRDALSGYLEAGQFPDQLGFNGQQLNINYTLDGGPLDWAEARLARYNPDYGVFVALEPDTGKILALATNRRDQQQSADLAFRGTYPAASTFKLITAAAVIEEGKAKPETVFSFNGKSTSLYRRQVFQTENNKWTRRMSFTTAFAKSVNPIFGRLGAKVLGPETLLEYAERFGFNAQFSSDFEFDNGSILIDTSDEWQAAESASGYTRRNTLSPIHGAVLAASIANGGNLISPSIVESVTGADNKVLYSASDKPNSIQVLSENSAQSMQKLMRATITEGTGRKSFRTMSKKIYGDVITGGKSGHLRGNSPKGQYDWFIGYGERDSQKIAYAMLCINKEKWYVKSARFAREAVEHYFKNDTSKMATKTSSETSIPTTAS